MFPTALGRLGRVARERGTSPTSGRVVPTLDTADIMGNNPSMPVLSRVVGGDPARGVACISCITCAPLGRPTARITKSRTWHAY